MTTAVSDAVTLLETWLMHDQLVSQVDAYLDSLRNPARSWTWYTELRDREGVHAAEERLRKMAEDLQLDAVGQAFEPVAEGMLALAEVNPTTRRNDPYVRVVRAGDDIWFPGLHRAAPDTQAVVVLNPEVPGCGCSQPEGSYYFGMYGLFGLKAVVLSVSPDYPSSTKLSLVLPSRRKDAPESAFVVAEFSIDGPVLANEISPRIYNDGAFMASLGFATMADAWGFMSHSGGNSDETFGPGCTDLLIKKLPDLGTYFKGVAEKLSGDHTH